MRYRDPFHLQTFLFSFQSFLFFLLTCCLSPFIDSWVFLYIFSSLFSYHCFPLLCFIFVLGKLLVWSLQYWLHLKQHVFCFNLVCHSYNLFLVFSKYFFILSIYLIMLSCFLSCPLDFFFFFLVRTISCGILWRRSTSNGLFSAIVTFFFLNSIFSLDPYFLNMPHFHLTVMKQRKILTDLCLRDQGACTYVAPFLLRMWFLSASQFIAGTMGRLVHLPLLLMKPQ